jgi:hypothetical protein
MASHVACNSGRWLCDRPPEPPPRRSSDLAVPRSCGDRSFKRSGDKVVLPARKALWPQGAGDVRVAEAHTFIVGPPPSIQWLTSRSAGAISSTLDAASVANPTQHCAVWPVMIGPDSESRGTRAYVRRLVGFMSAVMHSKTRISEPSLLNGSGERRLKCALPSHLPQRIG